MKKYKKRILSVLLVLLLLFTVAFVSYTYAKYTTTLPDKNGEVSVASWTFTGDNGSKTINVNLGNYATTKLAEGKIAPGTAGSFSVDLKNTSDVGVYYTIKVGTVTGGTLPTNLKFYSDSAHTNEITATTGINGTLDVGATTDVTKTIYWEWKYETTDGDAADTADGEAHSTLVVPFTITGTQVNPAN